MSKYIKSTLKLKHNDISEFGEKAVNLYAISTNGFYLSKGYAISQNMLQDFCLENNLSCNNSSIKSDIISGEFNCDMSDSLLDVWMSLTENNYSIPLIVRSSAIGEDGFDHSFAGIYESILNILSFEDMKIAIKKCWASYYSERAINYRTQNGIKSNGMGVIIQKMALGEKSGVLFTANPITGVINQSIIESCYGLNVGVVDGAIAVDQYVVDRGGRIITKIIAKKKAKYSLGSKSFELQIENIDTQTQQISSLSDYEIYELSAIGKEIENSIGYPCDIEWTIADNNIYILQCRPIILKNADSINFDVPFDCDISENIECSLLDRYAEPACICYLSLLKSWQEVVYLSFYDKNAGRIHSQKPLIFYFNRVYWNLDYQREFFDDIPFGTSNNKHFKKKVKLLFLLLNGSGSWYRRISKYEKLLKELDKKVAKVKTVIDIWYILQEALEVFCEYIGIDHYRFLGLAQVGYNQLSEKLNGLDKSKEVIAGLIESGCSKNMTIDSNLELFRLAQLAKSFPEVHMIFLTSSVEDIYGKISKLCALDTEKFKDEFDNFIKKHGHRGTSCDDLYSPHWVEKPEIVLEIIKQVLLNLSDNLKEFSKRDEDIRKCYKECEKKAFKNIDLHNKSVLKKVWKKNEIIFFAKMTSRYMALRENQRYYFDKSWLLIRKLVLAIADELSELGLIRETEDIFHLTIDEIELLIKNKKTSWQQTIDARIRTYNKNSKIRPPYLIKNDSLYRVQGKADKNSFKAVGISGGIAVGQVRIISDIKGLSEVKDGEIVVVSTFHPSWTPILGIVSGLVMNYGNILSHGAVVAREYRIPVVIFNDTATSVFENGQWIEINGDTGRIRVISETTNVSEEREFAII